MNKLIEWSIRVVTGLFLIVCGFALGWIIRAIKARKITKEQLVKEEAK